MDIPLVRRMLLHQPDEWWQPPTDQEREATRERAAELGRRSTPAPSQMHDLGTHFATVERDGAAARYWLKRAALAHPSSVLIALDLGRLLIDMGLYRDAMDWLAKPADAGFLDSRNHLGCAAFGAGFHPEAERIWREAALEPSDDVPWTEKGLVRSHREERADAFCNLGFLLAERGEVSESRELMFRSLGEITPGNEVAVGRYLSRAGHYDLAHSHLIRAVERGDAEAMYLLSENGRAAGSGIDAEHWRREAANHGSPKAKYELALDLIAEGDEESAVRDLVSLARKGHAAAAVALASVHELNGRWDEMWKARERAGELGHRESQWLMARRHLAKDPSHALIWLGRLADAGDTEAMFQAGEVAEQIGQPDTALRWYTKAARADHVLAMVNLGALIEEMNGDLFTARTWYELAAAQGNPDAMENISLMLAEEGDEEGAKAWALKAEANRGAAPAANGAGNH